MTDTKTRLSDIREEFRVRSSQLVDNVGELVAESNVRSVMI